MFLFPPWKKKLLKLEVKISISIFLSKYVFLPLLIQRKAICCVYLFLTFEDFLRPVKWSGKNKHIWKKVCAANYQKKNLHLINLTMKFQFKVFLWWYFSNYSMLLPHKIKLQSKNFQTPNCYNCLSHMVFISSKMSLVIGIFLWKSFKKWSL